METNDSNLPIESIQTTDKSKIIAMGAILFAILLSVGIYFYLKQKNPSKQTNVPSLNTTTSDDTSTFTHFSGIGFAMQYPQNLQTKKTTTEQKVTIDMWSPPEANYNIFVTSGADVSSIKFFTTGDKTEKVTIAGQETTKTTGYTKVGTVIHIGPITYKKKQYILVYDSGKYKATPESLKIFDSMVSTFAFGN